MSSIEQRVAELEAQVRSLQQQLADALESVRGEPGRDGRDGKDGRSPSAKEVAMAYAGLVQKTPPAISAAPAPNIVVQVAPPHVHLDLNADVVRFDGATELRESIAALTSTMRMPVRPVYDKQGKMLGGQRVPSLTEEEGEARE